ncbi:SurA N-terminal domain-containing protein [Halalkalibacillus halophilus]|uniref:SurA N-terminal domain-containing protein n=1 Tax=Halalkalibacillus halophilus TaxID=392827 RepID=UPI0003F64264|nr:SurA N-terminal domain-containing protein [Halalkalibacillus halophilus]
MKKMLMVLLLAIFSIMLVACNDDNGDGEASPEEENNQEETEQEEGAEGEDAEEGAKGTEGEEGMAPESEEEVDIDTSELDEGEVVATVNGEEIQASDLMQNEEMVAQQYQMYGIDAEENPGLIRQAALDQLVNTTIIQQNATESGLEPSDDELEEEYNSFVEELKQQHEADDIEEVYEEFEVTEEEVREDIRLDLMLTRFIEENTEETEVTDEEIEQAYEEYAAQAEQADQEVDDLEDMRPTLEQQVQEQNQSEQTQALIEDLREESDIEILI